MKASGLCIVVLLLSNCSNELINRSYASIGSKSINGVDAFTSILKIKSKKYISKSWMSKLILDDADLVVFFNKKNVFSKEQLLNLEAYLQRVNTEDIKPEDELLDDAESVFFEKNHPFYSATEVAKKTNLRHLYSEQEKKKTILYFLKDTTTEVSFYERVYNDLREFKEEKNYIFKYLKDSRSSRQTIPSNFKIPFGERLRLYKNGPLVYNFLKTENALENFISFYPVRYVPGPTIPFYIKKPKSRPILSVRGGDLIREFYFEKVRLILIYNSEAFLNYSLVRSQYQKFANKLIDYSLNGIKNPVIAYISKGLVTSSKSPKEEQNLFRFLTIFPVNVFILQFILFLIFYLLYKWPHQSNPLPIKHAGSRTFIEHFIALGAHLKRNKEKEEVLEKLIQYRKRRGFQIKENLKVDTKDKQTKELEK